MLLCCLQLTAIEASNVAIADLRNAAASALSEKAGAEAACSAARDEVTALRASLAAAEAIVAKTEAVCTSLCADVDRLKAELSQERSEVCASPLGARIFECVIVCSRVYVLAAGIFCS
ncbi:MAG: hypothetical protein P4L40_08770 [Terracidiphilus sp.]|nr:hypothetical protein [Terracidiphilus sp.]